MTELDEHEVVWDRYRSGPLAGLTLAKARIANDALWGCPVRVWSKTDLEARKSDYPFGGTDRQKQIWRAMNPGNHSERGEGEFGIFYGFVLPGSWGSGFECVFDMRIATSVYDHGTRVGSGSSRVLGMGALGELEVVGPAWAYCADCCCWRDPLYVRERARSWDWDWIAEDAKTDEGLVDYYHDLVCIEGCQA